MQNTGVILQSFVLGQVPPSVTGIKTHPPSKIGIVADELIVDVDFEWASKMQVQLQFRSLEDSLHVSLLDRVFSFVYKTIAVKVVVRDVVARGKLRVTVKPLLDTMPVVGAVNACLLDPPTFTYQLSSFGANPLFIPGWFLVLFFALRQVQPPC